MVTIEFSNGRKLYISDHPLAGPESTVVFDLSTSGLGRPFKTVCADINRDQAMQIIAALEAVFELKTDADPLKTDEDPSPAPDVLPLDISIMDPFERISLAIQLKREGLDPSSLVNRLLGIS